MGKFQWIQLRDRVFLLAGEDRRIIGAITVLILQLTQRMALVSGPRSGTGRVDW